LKAKANENHFIDHAGRVVITGKDLSDPSQTLWLGWKPAVW
jgi:hypothetical protein